MINSQKSIYLIEKGHTTPNKASWKNHINPEVTKLYEEISVHDSFDDEFTPRASRLSQRPMKEHLNTLNLAEQKRLPRTKAEILQDIRTYEEYLRIHSRPNLYEPYTPTLKRVKSTDSQLSLANKFVSLNELMEKKETKKKTLEEMVMARAESKIISTKQDFSTMHET